MLLECRCRWHDASVIGVRWCTRWWTIFWLHKKLELFGFDGFISMKLGLQSGIWENQREREIWTVWEECGQRRHSQIDHPSWRCRRLLDGGILTGKASLFLCMPLYHDDVGNGLILVLLKRTLSGRICREIFDSMKCGLVVLRMWSIAVWGKKCLWRCNVRVSASCKPVDAANNILIDLFLTRNISIWWVNGRNGVEWEAGTIRSHVGNLFCCVDWKSMRSVFSECRLALMDLDVFISVLDPSKGST